MFPKEVLSKYNFYKKLNYLNLMNREDNLTLAERKYIWYQLLKNKRKKIIVN